MHYQLWTNFFDNVESNLTGFGFSPVFSLKNINESLF